MLKKIENEVSPSFGVVVMMDALGVRNYSIDDSIEFIQKINSLINMVEGFIDYLPEKVREGEEIEAFSGILKLYDSVKPEICTFGDTFVISWEVKKEQLPDSLIFIAYSIAVALSKALDDQFLLRGAISYGDYVKNGTTILGPAITDVASWCEEADWMGVIATPYCSNFLYSIGERCFRGKEKGLEGDLLSIFKRYPVPFKKNGNREFWTVQWPLIIESMLVDKEKGESSLAWLYSRLSKFSVPKGTESKYSNTTDYFNKCLVDLAAKD